MASLNFSFDANEIEPAAPSAGRRELLPPGEYPVVITESEMRATAAGTGQYLYMKLEVTEGEHVGRWLFARLNLINPNPKAEEIARRELSAICRAIGVMQVQDSENLHGRPLLAVVKVRPAGQDRTGTHREASNEIGGYKPMAQPARPAFRPAAPAPAAPRPAAPAPAPTAAPAGGVTPPWRRSA